MDTQSPAGMDTNHQNLQISGGLSTTRGPALSANAAEAELLSTLVQTIDSYMTDSDSKL